MGAWGAREHGEHENMAGGAPPPPHRRKQGWRRQLCVGSGSHPHLGPGPHRALSYSRAHVTGAADLSYPRLARHGGSEELSQAHQEPTSHLRWLPAPGESQIPVPPIPLPDPHPDTLTWPPHQQPVVSFPAPMLPGLPGTGKRWEAKGEGLGVAPGQGDITPESDVTEPHGEPGVPAGPSVVCPGKEGGLPRAKGGGFTSPAPAPISSCGHSWDWGGVDPHKARVTGAMLA